MRIILPLLVVLSFVGCGPPTDPPSQLRPEPAADAGVVIDAGSIELDAGAAPDGGASELDAGSPDSGVQSDAGLDDAGASDASVDAGVPDAGSTDAGSTDAGSTDAGIDAGVPDAGCVCALPNYCDAMDRCVADAVPPRVTVAAQRAANDTQLHVTGTVADDETGVASVQVQLDSQSPVTAVVQGGQWVADLPISLSGAINHFTVVAIARDRANNEGRASTSLTIDVTGPAITLTPSQGAACANGVCTGAVVNGSATSFTLAANVVDPSGLASSSPVRVRVLDGATELVPPTDLTPSGSTFSWTWSMLPLVDGRTYTLEVTATDAGGNRSLATLAVLVDRLGPSVALTPSQSGACVAGVCSGAVVNAAASSFALTANVVDGQSLTASHPVRVRLLDGATEVVPSTDLSAAGSLWSWLWTSLPQVDGRSYVVEVTATDAAGNASQARVSVLVDRVGPTLSLTPAQDAACTTTSCSGAVVSAATGSLALSAQAADALGLAAAGAVRVRVLDGASVVVPATDLVPQGAAWGYTWAAPLVDGRFYSAEVTATDAAGNSTTRSRVVLVDRVNPTLVVNSPRQGTLVGAANVTINSSSSDGLGLRAVEVATDVAGPWVAAALDGNGDWVAQLPVPTVDAVEQTLSVRATDLVGNVRNTTTRYTADRVAPELTVAVTNFDCSSPNLCTGSVANALSTSVPYSGSVRDGSAVTLSRSVVAVSGGATMASSTGPQANGVWFWEWTGLPTGVNGAAYELRVVAADAAGNTTTEVRRTWLDNVAPTVTLPTAGQRLVPRTAVLALFSEPMSVSSVALTLYPTPSVGPQSSDGRSFSFGPGVLLPYTPYEMVVGTVSVDKAGNSTTGGPITFLTEGAPVTDVVAAGGVSWGSPRLVVDGDGRPTVAATQTTTSSASAFITTWTGSGWRAGPAPVAGASITDLRLASAAQLADRRLITNLDALVGTTQGGLQITTATSTWPGANPTLTWPAPVAVGTATVPLTVSTVGKHRPSLEYVPWRNLAGSGVTRTVVSPTSAATSVLSWTESGSQWSSSVAWTGTALSSSDGRASLEPTSVLGVTRVRIYDGVANAVVADVNFGRAATAQAPLKAVGGFGAVPTTATYVAYTTDTRLTVTCHPNPFGGAGSWTSSFVDLPSRASGTPLASALSSGAFVVAGEYGGNVVVHSVVQSTSCATMSMTRLGQVTGAKDPAVAIDPSGRIWVAYVSTTTGELKVQAL